eukprot:UN28197
MEMYYSTPHPVFNEKDISWQCWRIFQLLGRPSYNDIYYVGDYYFKLELPTQEKSRIPKLLRNSSTDLIDFIHCCLRYNPNERSAMNILIHHPLLHSKDPNQDVNVIDMDNL